jgi:hypothetical protein
MAGRSPDGSGSRPTGRASKAVSPVPASIPNAGFVSEAANVAASQWRWVAQSLHDSIANLGYPVGMGMSPSPKSTEHAAKLICEYIACEVDAAQAIEARRAATGNTDAVHESAVGTADAPNPGQSSGMPKGGEL